MRDWEDKSSVEGVEGVEGGYAIYKHILKN